MNNISECQIIANPFSELFPLDAIFPLCYHEIEMNFPICYHLAVKDIQSSLALFKETFFLGTMEDPQRLCFIVKVIL